MIELLIGSIVMIGIGALLSSYLRQDRGCSGHDFDDWSTLSERKLKEDRYNTYLMALQSRRCQNEPCKKSQRRWTRIGPVQTGTLDAVARLPMDQQTQIEHLADAVNDGSTERAVRVLRKMTMAEPHYPGSEK